MNKIFSNEINPFAQRHRALAGTTSGTPNAVTAMVSGSVTMTSLTRVGTLATFTATAAHRLVSGQTVKITGSTPDGFNGTYVITVTSTTVFTYVMAADPGAYSSGTVKAGYSTAARWACVYADAGNAADITIGPDANCDVYPVSAGQFHLIPMMPDREVFDMADWNVKSASASQTYKVLYY